MHPRDFHHYRRNDLGSAERIVPAVVLIGIGALFLLNNDFALVQARQLTARLIREIPTKETARIQRAFQLLFGRPASTEPVFIWQTPPEWLMPSATQERITAMSSAISP